MIIEVNSVLLLLKTACLGKIPFSRYGALGVSPTPLRLRFFSKKIFFDFFFFVFYFLIISFISIQVFPLMFSCSHTHHQWHQDLDLFPFFPIFYSICFNSIFSIMYFVFVCWWMASVLMMAGHNCVETSPTRTLQFSTQLSYEAKNSVCVRPSHKS